MPKSFLNMTGYPIGLRNNNPGNVRPFDPWKGMIGENGGFAVFENIAWGLRAMGKSIIHEINVNNNTVSKLIYEWAPPADNNNTEAYINSVVTSTGFSRNQVLTSDAQTLTKLMRAIMKVELGPNFAALITDSDIAEGLSLIDGGGISPGQAGFGISTLLFAFALYLLFTMPKVKPS
jgi:hypothetical protein